MSEGTGFSARVEELIDAMSTQEKIGQLIQYFYFKLPADTDLAATSEGMREQTRMVEEQLAQGRAGALLFVRDPADVNRLQRAAIEGNRHGIPALFGYDVIHGFRTVFPVPIGLAATWDESIIEEAQSVAAREARAVGIHWAFAPMVDIARDPRWGRMIEGAGEDPLLGSVVAAAQVRGFQGERLGVPGRLIAGPKHFLGYGAALGGRDYDEVDLSDQEIWNTYLPPFRAAVEAGAGNIMAAYMDLNGVPATGNRWLLTDVLRDELGFDGFVVSDADSVRDLFTHHFASDLTDAGVRGLNAGVDLEMTAFDPAFSHIEDALADGRLTVERLDQSVRRLLCVKEQLGLFESPYVDEDEAQRILSAPEHRVVARRAAEQAAVLLRNEGGLLPLDADRVGTVAVIGPLADSRRDIIGPWVFDHDSSETVTVVDGIRTYLDGRAQVVFERGVAEPKRGTPSIFDVWGDHSPSAPADFDPQAAFQAAIDAATVADVAVMVLGEQQDMIGENASRSELHLPGDQQRLLEAVVATGTPVVLVLMSGRPLDLRWAAEHVPAILEVWYPGTQGGTAVANLLFGDTAPAGRLPFTWPRSVGQVPIHHAVTRSHAPATQFQRYWNEESVPLFPFGYGLGYTSFEYADLRLDADTVGLDQTITVSVDVTNTGDRDGVEVVQLYLHQRYGTSSRPLRQLKAFQRVHVAAGATETITLAVGPDARRYWSAATRDWVLEPSVFDVWVGSDATAQLHAEFTVIE
ncbi:glycoside hydrolase family 3 N-terminal domain-containing protein [Tessaracoccus caeni]|uniref:glycoside hydrolase family 3 N-terminal domain-containing protein n=1 Tax=Tessaracoccus caeni TaxID=3031239 RepID=UPI0023DB5297|nr:glycoside hydrolase family 3 N-terminal domain-containing protein [Tessaracoccus caeni]MDF1488535.1 glycoside hydrolase family 3 N-terminal domain-containing protein [Tessaracoccus caeni]